jgi:flagellin-like protein
MSMGNNERSVRWRKKGKRGVSPIIATILLVAITVVLAAVLYILISGLTKGPGNTPLGTSLAMGQPKEAQAGATFYYNFSVASAGGGLVMNNLNFQVQTASGSIVTVTAGVMNVLSLSAVTVASYSMTTGAWTLGGSLLVNSQQQFALSTSVNLSGDKLVVSGSGTFQGSITVAIP